MLTQVFLATARSPTPVMSASWCVPGGGTMSLSVRFTQVHSERKINSAYYGPGGRELDWPAPVHGACGGQLWPGHPLLSRGPRYRMIHVCGDHVSHVSRLLLPGLPRGPVHLPVFPRRPHQVQLQHRRHLGAIPHLWGDTPLHLWWSLMEILSLQGDVRELEDGCDPCPGPVGGNSRRNSSKAVFMLGRFIQFHWIPV